MVCGIGAKASSSEEVVVVAVGLEVTAVDSHLKMPAVAEEEEVEHTGWGMGMNQQMACWACCEGLAAAAAARS